MWGALPVIALLHYFGLYGGGYGTYFWYDLMMHFIGGAWIAGVANAWLSSGDKNIKVGAKQIFIILFLVLVAGTLWEIFEFSFDTIIGRKHFFGDFIDTTWDMIMDISGGIAVVVLLKLKKEDHRT